MRHPEIRAAIENFVGARLEAHRIMQEAGRLQGLPDLLAAQARTIAGLAGLRLCRIVGEADPQDFLALRDDLEAVAAKVDPLIAAIGAEAAAGSTCIDEALFRAQLSGALDGNATQNLTEAAERAADDRDATGRARAFLRAAE